MEGNDHYDLKYDKNGSRRVKGKSSRSKQILVVERRSSRKSKLKELATRLYINVVMLMNQNKRDSLAEKEPRKAISESKHIKT